MYTQVPDDNNPRLAQEEMVRTSVPFLQRIDLLSLNLLSRMSVEFQSKENPPEV